MRASHVTDMLTHRDSLCNGFSYWQGQDVNNATATYFDNMMQAIGHIQDVAGSVDAVHIMNGETGWPTGNVIVSCSSHLC